MIIKLYKQPINKTVRNVMLIGLPGIFYWLSVWDITSH